MDHTEKMQVGDIIYREECFQIMGACFNLYNDKGSGFLEPVYQECLAIELAYQEIPFVAQPELRLTYRGRQLEQFYKPDFVCYGKIIVEIKAVGCLAGEHRAQLLNYLYATGFQLGLLVNFGVSPKLEWERLAHTGKKTAHE